MTAWSRSTAATAASAASATEPITWPILSIWIWSGLRQFALP
jgi:hypothetical protein